MAMSEQMLFNYNSYKSLIQITITYAFQKQDKEWF